jgi:hypothetical protein
MPVGGRTLENSCFVLESTQDWRIHAQRSAGPFLLTLLGQQKSKAQSGGATPGFSLLKAKIKTGGSRPARRHTFVRQQKYAKYHVGLR